ncbi:MAG: hypothetical protein FWC44_05120 [Methanomassiliicoccaceae archaeon]|nr:hypothetical protein [Methanomassiliicoccaceae archaeon]
MASKKKESPKEEKKGNQPKATARHAKMNKTRQEEIEALKSKIETEKHQAKKYESNRKTEIKALPKEDRPAAKEELKESIRKRKDAEERDREKLQAMMNDERAERISGTSKDSFDEDAWILGGRRNKKKAEKNKKE